MPCVRASTQLRSASVLSSIGPSVARLKWQTPAAKTPAATPAQWHEFLLERRIVPGRQVMNTNCGGGVCNMLANLTQLGDSLTLAH